MTDSPIDINAVLYIAADHDETPGSSRMTPNLSLYCKKVLIRAKCADLLPEWMRFVQGIVDSEELPLTVSRSVPHARGPRVCVGV